MFWFSTQFLSSNDCVALCAAPLEIRHLHGYTIMLRSTAKHFSPHFGALSISFSLSVYLSISFSLSPSLFLLYPNLFFSHCESQCNCLYVFLYTFLSLSFIFSLSIYVSLSALLSTFLSLSFISLSSLF